MVSTLGMTETSAKLLIEKGFITDGGGCSEFVADYGLGLFSPKAVMYL
jgi:hypothetical protein